MMKYRNFREHVFVFNRLSGQNGNNGSVNEKHPKTKALNPCGNVPRLKRAISGDLFQLRDCDTEGFA